MQYLNLACENIIVHDFAAEMTFWFIYDQTTASRPMTYRGTLSFQKNALFMILLQKWRFASYTMRRLLVVQLLYRGTLSFPKN